MALDRVDKQGWEKFPIGADFSDDFVTGETVDVGNSTVTAVDKDGADATSEIIAGGKGSTTNPDNEDALPNATLTILIFNGTEDKQPYKVTFQCVTSLGHQYEHDVEVRVKEL